MLFVILIFTIIILANKIDKKIDTKIDKLIEDKVKKTEQFIVADAQDFHNYDKLRAEAVKKEDNFAKSDLDNPPPNKIVDYDQEIDKDKDFSMMVVHGNPQIKRKEENKKAYVTDVDFGWEAPVQHVACANSSIAEKWRYGDKSLLPFQIGCNQPNKLTAENYYKTHYKAQIIPIEDYNVRGSNYLDYTSFMTPYQVRGYRILSENTKGLPPAETKIKNIPVAFNYSYHNTPAMSMP